MAKEYSKQESFILYFSDKDIFDSLTDEQAGALIKNVFAFKVDGEIAPNDDPLMKLSFNMIKGHLERDAKKYAIECAKRQKSAHKKHWLDAYGSQYPNRLERDEAFEVWWNENKENEIAIDESDDGG